MTNAPRITVEQLDWRGILIEIRYEAEWLGRASYLSHIELETIEPARARLPITETGYLSHFLSPEIVEEAGGAAAYVALWLDEAAGSRDDTWRQLMLF